MKPFSFRLIISLTLIAVVGTISYFAIYFYNSSLSKKMLKDTEEEVKSVLSILQNHYIHTISQNGGKVLYPLLDDLKGNKRLKNSFIVDTSGRIIYPTNYNSLKTDTIDLINSSEHLDDISFKSFTSEPDPFLRAYIRLPNSEKCFECHNASNKYLGTIVFDISLAKTIENRIFTRKFSIIYSVIILVFVLSMVFTMHYRFVRTSLSKFYKSIGLINQGNLSERVDIPNSRELGELAKSFNAMVETFQKTQWELQHYHQLELQNTHKLATIGEMAARLAHEIRNPLTGIANAIEIIINEMPENRNKPILEEIRRQAYRINIAISNILRYSRTSDLKIESRNINEIITALVFFIKNQTLNKKIEFKQDLQANIPPFKFDHEQIENVLLNLGLNSIQAIEDKGTITFKSVYNANESKVLITVEDDGRGIPEHIIKEVFNPFYTTRAEGTGLGLAIAKEFIEKHKGNIWLESQESKGTKFYISLPFNTSEGIA